MRLVTVCLLVVAAAAILASGGSARSSDDGDLSLLGNKRSVLASDVQAKGKKHHQGEASVFECTAPSGGANTIFGDGGGASCTRYMATAVSASVTAQPG